MPSEIIHACGIDILAKDIFGDIGIPNDEIERKNVKVSMLKDTQQRRQWEKRVEGRNIKQILELGIYYGGSIPYLFDLCDADFIVGLEINEFNSQLVNALEQSSLRGSFELYYETDQSDVDALEKIMARHFANGIDLIVDDASHLLTQSRTSFEFLFPKVRPGGLYVIEDYGWGQSELFRSVAPRHYLSGEPGLVQIILELSMLFASQNDWISSIEIDHNVITIERGMAVIPEPMNLQASITDWAGLDYNALKSIADSI